MLSKRLGYVNTVSDVWITKTNYPNAANTYGSGVYDGEFAYIIGGYYNLNSQTNAYRQYDVSTNTWSLAGTLPNGNDYMLISHYYNGNIYSIGSYGRVYKYTKSTGTFTTVMSNSFFSNRKFGTGGGKYIYCSEGITLYMYDCELNTVTNLGAMPLAPNTAYNKYGGMGIIGDYLYVIGGNQGKYQVVAYEISTGTWITEGLPQLPVGRHSFAYATLDDKIYVFGGSTVQGGGDTINSGASTSNITNTCYVFDGIEWKSIKVLTTAVCYSTAVSLSGMILHVGGWYGVGVRPNADMYMI